MGIDGPVALVVVFVLLVLAVIVLVTLAVQNGRLTRQIEDRARDRYDQWIRQERDRIRAEEHNLADAAMQVTFEQWQKDDTKRIREEAIKQSGAVTVGKVTEHLAPYLSNFNYNPKDVRFLGSPVDLVVFDGLSDKDGKDTVCNKIVFVEVKSGASSLSTRERRVRDAVCEKRVEWEEFRVPSPEGG